MGRSSAGSALLEFAIAWPVALLLVLGTVQVAVWGSEAYAVRQAALAGARAGSATGGSAAAARDAALAALRPYLVGTAAGAWCPGDPGPPPAVRVCAGWEAGSVEVSVAGAVPALVPLVPGGPGLPVAADVTVPREVFR